MMKFLAEIGVPHHLEDELSEEEKNAKFKIVRSRSCKTSKSIEASEKNY